MNQQFKTFIEWLKHLEYKRTIKAIIIEIEDYRIKRGFKPNSKPLTDLDKRLIENGFLLS
jgi:hypothetical protein